MRDEACQYLGGDSASKGEEDQREGSCEHVAVLIFGYERCCCAIGVERIEKKK